MTDMHGTTGTAAAPPEPRNPAEIELEIQRTRARMTENVDALTWKLSPDRLKARARYKLHETQEAVVEKVRDTAHEVGDQARQAGSGLFGLMRENPIPTAMIGAGVAWLIAGSRRHARDEFDSEDSYGGYYAPDAYVPVDTAATTGVGTGAVGTAAGGIQSSHADLESEQGRGMGERAAEMRERVSEKTAHARERVAEKTAHARERVRDKAHMASERASDLRHDAADRARHLRHGAADRARRTRGWAEQQMDENPLVMGAAVLALGAVVGSLVPTTRREDELIGPRRDRLMDRARSTMHEAREVIGTTARETIDSVKEEAGMQKDTLRSTAEDLGAELATSAKKVAHDAKETARTEAEQRHLM